MANRVTLVILWAACVFWLAGYGGQSYTPIVPPPTFSSTVTSIVNQSYTTYGLPATSIAIARDGVPFHKYSVGDVDLTQKTEN